VERRTDPIVLQDAEQGTTNVKQDALAHLGVTAITRPPGAPEGTLFFNSAIFFLRNLEFLIESLKKYLKLRLAQNQDSKAVLSTESPHVYPHLVNQAKKEQLLEERYTQIEYENRCDPSL
jgi:hypothetical protein